MKRIITIGALTLAALSGCSLQSTTQVREYTMHYKDNDMFCANVRETSTGGKKIKVGSVSFSNSDTRRVVTPAECNAHSLPYDPNVLI